MEIMDDEIKINSADLNSMLEKLAPARLEILMGINNETVNLVMPRSLPPVYVRSSVANVYPLLIAMYFLLAVTGTVTNGGMIFHIVWKKINDDPTYGYLIHIAICNVIMNLIVLPFELAVQLVQNSIFGKFLCYILPILQDALIHASMMTYVLIASQRYRFLSELRRCRISAFVCALLSWFFAGSIVLPRFISISYLNLKTFGGENFRGVGTCVANLNDNLQSHFVTGLFLLTYIAPLTIIAYIYAKAGQKLRTQEELRLAGMFDARAKNSHSSRGSSTTTDVTISCGERENGSVAASETAQPMSGRFAVSHTYDLYDAELDVCKEKRNQKYLISMVFTFAVLYSPLIVLNLTKLFIVETYGNADYFDILFTMIVWLAFTSTVSTPIIYASWQMGRLNRKRLRAGFRCPGRRQARNREHAMKTTKFRKVPRQSRCVSNVGHAQTMRIANISESDGIIESCRGCAGLPSPLVGGIRENRTILF